MYSGGHRTLSVQEGLDGVAMGNAIDDRYRRGQFAHDEAHVICRQSDVGSISSAQGHLSAYGVLSRDP